MDDVTAREDIGTTLDNLINNAIFACVVNETKLARGRE